PSLRVALWLDLRELSYTLSRQQTLCIGIIITDIRGLYASDVVNRILSAAPGDKATPVVANYHDIPGAIPIPATFSIAMGSVIAARDSAIRYDFVSDFPFARREPYELTPFQRAALDAFRANPKLQSTETSSGALFELIAQIAFPIRLSEGCVSCHNSPPDS